MQDKDRSDLVSSDRTDSESSTSVLSLDSLRTAGSDV